MINSQILTKFPPLFLQKRIEVFEELLGNNSIDSVSVDTNQSEKLLRVLDTVVIKLEGGTEEDIEALDEKPETVVAEKSDTDGPAKGNAKSSN